MSYTNNNAVDAIVSIAEKIEQSKDLILRLSLAAECHAASDPGNRAFKGCTDLMNEAAIDLARLNQGVRDVR